jgi:hypothetical protein
VQQPRRRPNQVTVDLQAYKQPWLDWCKANDVTSSVAFRAIVQKLTSKAMTPAVVEARTGVIIAEAEKPTIRKEVALTPSESVMVEELAASDGFSAAKWIVGLIRARLTMAAQFGQLELEALDRSNMRLLAIGRNLNQVARALNTAPHDRSAYRVDLIEELGSVISEHTKAVSNAMKANLERWRIE